MSNMNEGGTMRDIKEIQKEIKRCEIERDLLVKGDKITNEIMYRMLNDRVWDLKWVLEEN